jgi:hypothetical protein
MRKPDLIIGDNYLRRWHLIPRNKWFNVYLHNIRKSDDDRAMHDHPYWNVSIILRGWYIEHVPGARHVCKAGSIIVRPATALHRLEVPLNGSAWSLFITGRRVRTWGFQCPQGWRPYFKFVDPNNPGQPGAGCGEP